MSKFVCVEIVHFGLDEMPVVLERLAALKRLATFIAEYPTLPNFPHRRYGIKSRYKGKVRFG